MKTVDDVLQKLLVADVKLRDQLSSLERRVARLEQFAGIGKHVNPQQAEPIDAAQD